MAYEHVTTRHAPLIHIDITGNSQGGKNKLIARFFVLIPDRVQHELEGPILRYADAD